MGDDGEVADAGERRHDVIIHGAEIFTELSVSRVVKADGGWHVYFAPSDAKDGGETFVAARTVVLAAGTLGSTEILLRSRERGLALSDHVGERFSANGDIIAFALGGREKVNAVGVGFPPKFVGDAIGACVTGEIELNDDGRLDHSMFIQEGVLPSALAPLLPVFFISGGRLLGAAQSLIKGVYHGPLQSLYTFFVVSHAPERLHQLGDAALLAECGNPHLFQRAEVACLGDRGKQLALDPLERSGLSRGRLGHGGLKLRPWPQLTRPRPGSGRLPARARRYRQAPCGRARSRPCSGRR